MREQKLDANRSLTAAAAAIKDVAVVYVVRFLHEKLMQIIFFLGG